jgi:hypothetical protein
MMPTGKRMNAPAPLINTPKLDPFIMSDNRRKNAETKQKPTLAFFFEKIVHQTLMVFGYWLVKKLQLKE